jgi:protein phosphatase
LHDGFSSVFCGHSCADTSGRRIGQQRKAGAAMLEIAYGIATDPGTRRPVNEDAAIALPRLVAVADGMGGHAAGEVASCLAVKRLEQLASGNDALSTDEILCAIADANRIILSAAAEDPGRIGMGTTLTGVGITSIAGTDHWVVFNVGDSRVYQLNGDLLSQVTIDHSEVEELVAAGELTESEARMDPRRNVVTRSLGTDPAPQTDVWVFPPTAGERFLVCSDGLTIELTDIQITEILLRRQDPQVAAEELVASAVGAGGRDNVTAIVVDVAGSEKEQEISVDTAPRPEARPGAAIA